MERNKLYHGLNLDVMRTFPDNCLDSVPTDPPYGINFMGKKWDYEVPSVEVWKEVFRVLKPGGHVLSFGSTRTYHRMVVNIEDAGFEIRDQLQWLYGSGFPKSMDVSKAIDKAAGVERELLPNPNAKKQTGQEAGKGLSGAKASLEFISPNPICDQAKEWQGWGTALKPANEPICLARKPFDCTVVENVLRFGTGALNIDATRIDFTNEADIKSATWGRGTDILGGNYVGGVHSSGKMNIEANNLGRWPANVIYDGSEEVLAYFPIAPGQQGDLKETGKKRPEEGRFGDMDAPLAHSARLDNGSAARFFYCAKPTQEEKNAGLKKKKNIHTTVKPIALMEYLIKLITPKGGIVFDPYAGSGTTLIAAKKLGFDYVGIEMLEEHCHIAEARLARYAHQSNLFA